MRRFALLVLGLAGLAGPAVAAGPHDFAVGVQLWSVRDDLARDFEGTLKQLADMGFTGVEFAGEFGAYADRPEDLKALLDRLGLKAEGSHVGFDLLDAAHFDATVAFYRALDCHWLIVPFDARAHDPGKVDELAEDLNRLDARLRPLGMRVGYHSHADEFSTYRDGTFWDELARETNRDVILQLDVGWATFAHQDPAIIVRRYPGRTLTTHLKASLPEGYIGPAQPIIGADTIDWPGLIRTELAIGGTRWLVVEQEDYPNGWSPMRSLRASKQGLDAILKTMGLDD